MLSGHADMNTDADQMGNFFGLPAFQAKYGDEVSPGRYNVSAGMQTSLKQVTKAGQIIGLLVGRFHL